MDTSDIGSDTESLKVEAKETSIGNGETESAVQKKKEHKRGIIYLSSIPPKMNVTQVRDYFSQYGAIDRSFLQPDKNSRKGRKNQTFTEGWIEFKRRKHAKEVARVLNNTPLGGKKRKQTYDFLWNIKYLTGLQWVHINERLAYERISRQQKMRAEISAAKRETSFFAKSVGLNKALKKGKKLKTIAPPALTEIENNDSDHETQPEPLPSKSQPKSTKLKPNRDSSISNLETAETASSTERTKETGISKSRLKLFQSFFPTQT